MKFPKLTNYIMSQKSRRSTFIVIMLAALGLPHAGFNTVRGSAKVIVEQSQSAPTVEPEKPDKKRTYVQPRWVDGGYGVEILQPGHWIEPESSR